MKISIIVAADTNNAIGKNNDLLWHLPRDMRFFKEMTTGHHILSGRKNYESIPKKYRPLANRTNIVVTRNLTYSEEGIEVVNSIEEGIELARVRGENELFIIGGGEIYKQAINQAHTLYLTRVDAELEADTFFPEISSKDWELIDQKAYLADEKNPYNLSFCKYISRNKSEK